ncbi:MAG: hypothetical protein HGA47_12900, partial [Zoogloea sp.]|nr:hypothetical protein [Zoogloea sp.]
MQRPHKLRLAAMAAALSAGLLAASAPQAAEVAGVRIEDRIRSGDTELTLNGAGLRTRLFFRVYAAALYVPNRSRDAASLVDSTELRRLRLYILRDIDSDTLLSALREGLHDNNTDAEITALKPQIDQFTRLMSSLGQARSGDTIDLDFSQEGVAVSLG